MSLAGCGWTPACIWETFLLTLPRKVRWVFLGEINTIDNMVHGAPSTLLTCIKIGSGCFIGDVKTVHIKHPEYKCLHDDSVCKLKLTFKEEHGSWMAKHSLPIFVTLEIRSEPWVSLGPTYARVPIKEISWGAWKFTLTPITAYWSPRSKSNADHWKSNLHGLHTTPQTRGLGWALLSTGSSGLHQLQNPRSRSQHPDCSWQPPNWTQHPARDTLMTLCACVWDAEATAATAWTKRLLCLLIHHSTLSSLTHHRTSPTGF